jgi:hypothetical protein
MMRIVSACNPACRKTPRLVREGSGERSLRARQATSFEQTPRSCPPSSVVFRYHLEPSAPDCNQPFRPPPPPEGQARGNAPPSQPASEAMAEAFEQEQPFLIWGFDKGGSAPYLVPRFPLSDCSRLAR